MSTSNNHVVMRAENIGLYYQAKNKLDFSGKHRFWALKDISFELYKGECLGIIGRNGAGKSTLLRIVAGIMEPDSGIINRYGSNVALLTLGAGFINELSGRDNMIMSAMLLGLTKKQAMQKLDAMIEFSELQEFVDEPIFTYSTGMRARLGFSVAIQSDPDVILVDEVLGVGDANFHKKSSAEMQRLIQSGKTVVLISHNKRTIQSLCSRAVLINGGTTVASGNVETVLKEYEQVLKS